MIKIFLLDRRLLPTDASVSFGKQEAERLAAIKNPQRKLESLSALVALDNLIRLSFDDAKFEILRAENGKPYFRDSDIYFSLSHSGDISVAAICDEKNTVIGIDVEKITERTNTDQMAERFFSSVEKDDFCRLGKTNEAFFKLWTKKEALAKMSGAGLASMLGDNALGEATISNYMCYEFYNNKDAYALALQSSSKINCVEFYNNSSDIKLK